jgi:hypothetical protein
MGFSRVGDRATGVGAVLSMFLFLVGCPGPDASLTIDAPMNGATLTLANDTNADIDGLQIEVTATAVGLAEGDDVDILIDGSTIAATAAVPADGILVFRDVTITSGEHTLQAVAEAADIRSEMITVTVDAACYAVGFIDPIPTVSAVSYGPEDDTDGEACGTTFETTVIASTNAPDGTEARVLVNGAPVRTASVSGGAVRFEDVAFGNRMDVPNTLEVQVLRDGVPCSATFPSSIFVDCRGASCTITAPESDGFLNQGDDVSDTPGFQGDFEVTTDDEGAGQDVRLIIDGNESGALVSLPDGLVASFGNVSLSDGVHRLVAECDDGAGNVTRSPVAEWTVDVVPCDVQIDSPDNGTLFIDSDDLDGSLDGIQIDAIGGTGSDCTEMRVGVCSGIDGMSFEPAQSGWTERVTLGTSATQQICAQTHDEAGNLATAMVDIRVQTASPQLEIGSPSTGAAFNLLGGGGRIADLTTGNSTCEAQFEVYCTGVGSSLDLIRQDTSITLGSATCVADATVPAPYTGRASFAALSLPSLESGGSYNVIARQEVDRLVGTSAPISVRPDCIAPILGISRPTCGSTLRPSMDENMSTPELDYRTNVQFTNGQSGDSVSLAIQPSGGGAPVYSASLPFTVNPVSFFGASYGAGGSLDIVATSTDSAGNAGSSAPCSVTVVDLPTVNLMSPSMGTVLGMAADCDDGTAGLQVRVLAETDAESGSSATVTVGAGAPVDTTVVGDFVDICVDAPDGRSVTFTVAVTDVRGTGSASVTVAVDTMAPSEGIDDLTATVVDRRGGVVRFQWTAVGDAGGFTLTTYELRCSDSAIVSETDWDEASVISILTTPGSPDSVQSEDVEGFRTGETRHCVLRGGDPAGELTPLPSGSTAVSPAFLTQEVTASGTTRFGGGLSPVGDVNGDDIVDFIVGATSIPGSGTNEVYVYFGSDSGLAATPNVRIIGNSGWSLGDRNKQLAAIGDFNGDGLDDFAIGAPRVSTNFGAVLVFYGRPSGTPWPATIMLNLDPGVCSGADVCFMSDRDSTFGISVSAAGDFDGDGPVDLAIGAPRTTLQNGRVYVLLGSATAYPSGTRVEVPGTGAGPNGFYVEGDGTVHRRVGDTVASLGGDLDGDGRDDLLLSSGGRSSPTPVIAAIVDRLPGRAYTGSGLQGIALTALDRLGTGEALLYGESVVGAGDVDGDAILDAIVYERSPSVGVVRVHLGRRTGFSGGTIFQYVNDTPASSADQFGNSLGQGRLPFPTLGNIGDIDEDGLVDVLVGSVQFSDDGAGNPLPGVGDLFYRDRSSSSVNRSVRSASVGPGSSILDNDGAKIAYIGDVNGDGFPDIAMGDPGYSTGTGRVVIYY